MTHKEWFLNILYSLIVAITMLTIEYYTGFYIHIIWYGIIGIIVGMLNNKINKFLGIKVN